MTKKASQRSRWLSYTEDSNTTYFLIEFVVAGVCTFFLESTTIVVGRNTTVALEECRIPCVFSIYEC